jgi:hypothetical protein
MPLVYAVGGVDEHDRPLINARAKGSPRLVALGSNGLVAGAGGSTEPLTGSSVSAAVVSATAALVWSYVPKLRPHEVVDIIYNAGLPLGSHADFELTGSGDWEISRASVCSALERACNGQDPDECPTDLDCKLVPAPDNMDHFFGQVETLVNDPSTKVDEIDTGLSGDVPVCESFNWTELADPQPETPICSRCNMIVPAGNITGDDILKMTTNPEYDGLVVTASLTTVDGAGMPTIYPLDGSVILSLNSPITNVTTVYLDAPTAVAATLNVELVDGTKQANSIPVKVL